jgi:hypothetical protein
MGTYRKLPLRDVRQSIRMGLVPRRSLVDSAGIAVVLVRPRPEDPPHLHPHTMPDHRSPYLRHIRLRSARLFLPDLEVGGLERVRNNLPGEEGGNVLVEPFDSERRKRFRALVVKMAEDRKVSQSAEVALRSGKKEE